MPETATQTPRASGTTDDIVDAVRQLILDGLLAPGEKLKEMELASRFSVSRTPVREALAALENEGLLTYEMHRGYTVRQFSMKDLLESYEMRALLEGHSCRIAAERGLLPELDRQLSQCLDRSEAILDAASALSPEEVKTWHELNIRFHGLLLQAVDSNMFERIARSVYRVPRIFDVVHIASDVESLKRYAKEHRRIYEAIKLRQSQRAEFLMREHVQNGYDIISEAMAAAERNDPRRLIWPHVV
ncbi:GntR family transcriptional regulator [Rhodobium gokarnense]|uniref:GntR family transcriptional regulator of vanillate catabolism n=1 Tax=Rhodobium gokarnense TaxID=364296 RepID=A0ABT3H6C8_9HYPH|nr:GntR family transcriptional regulator [Rhodobium gokarnense]MCW2305881.1 GntR family transcriptional regulator of vanillate catabolism [Rhodobium gokarnense]